MAIPCEPPLCIFHLDYVDLCRWRDSESQYQAGFLRLLDGIASALCGEKRYRNWHHQLNPWDFAAYLNQKRRNFTGREWLFDEIDAWRVGSNERALLITGDPGVGKSAVVAQLVHLNPDGQVIAHHCCQADTLATPATVAIRPEHRRRDDRQPPRRIRRPSQRSQRPGGPCPRPIVGEIPGSAFRGRVSSDQLRGSAGSRKEGRGICWSTHSTEALALTDSGMNIVQLLRDTYGPDAHLAADCGDDPEGARSPVSTRGLACKRT